MTYDLVISGTLVLSDQIVRDGWLAVSGEKIAAIGEGELPPHARFIDAFGKYLVPGLVDGQTHATSYKGLPGIDVTSQSALAGGITTMVDMPYDNPDPLNTVERFKAKRDAVETYSHCDVALYATVAPGQGTSEMLPLAKEGVCAFKISSIESHPVRFPRLPADEMMEILQASVTTGLPVGLHNEDQEIVRARIAHYKAAGQVTPEYHELSRPVAAELAATAQFLELGRATGAHVHIVHISTPLGFQMVKDYAQAGVRATGELCVHYLHFDAGRDIERLGARMKVSPPIRAGLVDGLWEEVEQGRVAFISSDHSSWPIDNKLTDSIFDAGAGIPGLETMLPSFITDAAPRYGLDGAMQRLATHFSLHPAQFFGLYPRKGALAVGADADIAVIEPGTYVYDEAQNHDGLNWSPYDGETFSARVAATVRRGEVVYSEGQILSTAGSGRYIPRT